MLAGAIGVTTRRVVKINERGYRIGEDHPSAQLTDHEVELMLQLRESEGWGWRRLAKTFEISKSQARRICLYVHRSQTVAGHRAVIVEEKLDVSGAQRMLDAARALEKRESVVDNKG